MRISDWSSDVCSSDLEEAVGAFEDRARREESGAREERRPVARLRRPAGMQPLGPGTVGQVLDDAGGGRGGDAKAMASCCARSEEHTSELQSLMRISYAVFCLKTKKKPTQHST